MPARPLDRSMTRKLGVLSSKGGKSFRKTLAENTETLEETEQIKQRYRTHMPDSQTDIQTHLCHTHRQTHLCHTHR